MTTQELDGQKLEPAPVRTFTFLNSDDISIDGQLYSADFVRAAVNERAPLISRVSQLESDCRMKDEALREAKSWAETIASDERVAGFVHQSDYSLYCLLADCPVDFEAALSPTPQPDAERCPICSWPYAESREKGCVPGDCSYRPREGTAEYERVKRNRERVTQPDAAPADDIVARLRLHQIEEGKSFFALWDEAANEIERLRASLLPADDVIERAKAIEAVKDLRDRWVASAQKFPVTQNATMGAAISGLNAIISVIKNDIPAANLLRQSATPAMAAPQATNLAESQIDHDRRMISGAEHGSASPPADVAGMREKIKACLYKDTDDAIADAILALLPSDAAVKALVEALKFYAAEDNYRPDKPITVQEDRGEIARATLAASGVKA